MSNDKGAKAPKSNADRQAAYRARKAQNGLIEVRGIFSTAENAEKIRLYAQKLSDRAG
jgi:hypothetical protein